MTPGIVSTLDDAKCACGGTMRRTFTSSKLVSDTVIIEKNGVQGLLPVQVGDAEWTCSACGKVHQETVAFMVPLASA